MNFEIQVKDLILPSYGFAKGLGKGNMKYLKFIEFRRNLISI